MAAGMDADVDSTFQLVIDQLEELVVTLVEEIRERPAVALAIVAGLLGAFVGARLARRRSQSVVARAGRKAADLGSFADLAGIAMRLLKNPIVRTVLITAVERQFKRRMAL